MDRQAAPLSLSLVVAFAFTGTGCLATHKVGIGSGSFTSQQRTALSCLGQTKGGSAELTEGEQAGRPVARASGVAMLFSPLLHESFEQDGAQVFVGQSCLADLRVCDSMLVVKNGRWRAAVYWMQRYPAPRQLPSSAREVFDEVREPLVTFLRAVDLDPLALGELQSQAATWRPSTNQRVTLELPTGSALASLAAGIQVPGDFKSMVALYPRLAPLTLAIGLVGGGGKFPGESGIVCVGATGGASPR